MKSRQCLTNRAVFPTLQSCASRVSMMKGVGTRRFPEVPRVSLTRVLTRREKRFRVIVWSRRVMSVGHCYRGEGAAQAVGSGAGMDLNHFWKVC